MNLPRYLLFFLVAVLAVAFVGMTRSVSPGEPTTSVSGRFQIAAGKDVTYVLDTQTGQVWGCISNKISDADDHFFRPKLEKAR